MSDDADAQIHENSLLASAYLDGEATADERALVETSPEALAEVDALSQVRAVLAATAPASSLSEREAHLAGALDVWERMSDLERSGEATPARGVDGAAGAAVLTPTSTSEGRRVRGGRRAARRAGSIGASQWLLGAAATLVVVAGGAAVVRGILAEDPATNDVAFEQSDEGAGLSEVEENEAAEVAGDNVGSDGVLDPDVIEGQAQANPDEDGGLFAEEAREADSAAADAPADEAVAAEQPAPAPEIDRVELESPEDLADYGSLVIPTVTGVGPAVTSDIDFEAPGESCEADFGIQERLEPARYQGEDVFVGVDLVNDIVYAYTEDCTLVESVSLPPPPTQP